MAKRRISKESLAKFRQQIQQRRKERKATASGTTRDINMSGTFVDVSYWDAFFYDGALWITAIVSGKSDYLTSCEIFLTPESGGPRSADGFAVGNNLGTSLDVGALTDLIASNPGMVHSELTGYTSQGNFFQYQADMYVYDLSATAKAAAGGR